MPTPRKSLVSLEATPYYHCVSRCVRRAYLCGKDSVTGRDFEHRRQFIEDRILNLSQVFAIEVCAYAVMSNHYHVVVHIHQKKAESFSDLEVVVRWHQLFKGTELTRRFAKGEALSPAEHDTVLEKVALWRTQLMDLGWFIRCINEPIARQANLEDQCTGRFWEGRYKSQALLDEQALAACMAYVDLNPIRADMADMPEHSDHTSVKYRIEEAQNRTSAQSPLRPFVGNPRRDMPDGLPFHFHDYLALVDWTGRILREDKRGAISSSLPPILERLDIDPKHWCFLATRFESHFKSIVGTTYSIKKSLSAFHRQRCLAPVIT